MARIAKLRKIERKDRGSSKWGISVPQPGKRSKRIFFESAAKRDAHFAKLKRAVQSEGHGILSTSAADVALLSDLREILPVGVDPREAARFYVEQLCPDSTVSLKEAVRGFLRKQQAARISQDHYKHQELALKRLTTGVGDEMMVAAVSQDIIHELLFGMPFKDSTLDGYHKNWGTFFNWCVKQRFCAVSPLATMDRISLAESEPEFMPAGDVAKFFKKALKLHPEITPALALSFFAGMRSSAIARLERGDLDFEQHGIRHKGASHKMKRRFYVQGFEPNLWEWLEPWKNLKTLPIWPSSTAIKWREDIYKSAKVAFPHNAGRHSFCTYHVALHGSADRTATLLTHRGSISMLYDHYRGNAKKTEAEVYFKILP